MARYPLWENLLLPYLPAEKNARILDVGCGDGAILTWLLEIGYTNVLGIDLSAEEVEIAQYLGLPVRKADMNTFLRESEGGFDLVILRNVLEHNYKHEILVLLEGIRATLAEGGRLFIQVPNAESPFGSRIRYGDFTHEIAFTSSSISQLLRVCGYVDIEVGPVDPVFRGRRRWRWMLVKRIYEWLLFSEVPMANQILTQDLHAVATRKGA